jgi:hypothetical protein
MRWGARSCGRRATSWVSPGSEGALDIEVDVVPDGRQLTHASTSV